eukprot:3772858-Rhodomonas_salina.2
MSLGNSNALSSVASAGTDYELNPCSRPKLEKPGPWTFEDQLELLHVVHQGAMLSDFLKFELYPNIVLLGAGNTVPGKDQHKGTRVGVPEPSQSHHHLGINFHSESLDQRGRCHHRWSSSDCRGHTTAANGAITLCSTARCQNATSRATFNAGAYAETGSVDSGAAITLGANTGTLPATGATTLGAGVMCSDDYSSDIAAPHTHRTWCFFNGATPDVPWLSNVPKDGFHFHVVNP